MYCEFFGFKENPFKITPDPRYMFLSQHHREAFAHLLYGIQQHSGFIEIIGEVGSGKTTILRALLNELDDQQYKTALIFNPCLSAQELLRSINREYGLPADNLSTAMLLDELNLFLLRENSAGRTVVLVVDEAQNLDPQVLEQIRLISNLETESDKLIQIVLAGQPELGNLLADHRLRQLSQRITVRYQLLPMNYEDTCAYITHRMELAGGWKAATFETGALKKIFRYSGGLPRLINVTCDRALLVGFTEESRNITSAMTAQAIKEISQEKQTGRRMREWLKPAAVAAAILIITGAALYALPGNQRQGSPAVPQAAPVQAAMTRKTVPAVEKSDVQYHLKEAQGKLTATESGRLAINAILATWQVKQVQAIGGALSGPTFMEIAAARGLNVLLFKGELHDLLSLGLPAVLQVSLPGTAGDRYIAVTGEKDGMLTLAPPMPSSPRVALAELQEIWSGRGYVFWNNFLDIPPVSLPGTKGEHIRLLQQLLQKVGSYGGRLNGIFDSATIDALRSFQLQAGIAADGKLTDTALLLLYRDAEGFPVPELHKKGKRQPA